MTHKQKTLYLYGVKKCWGALEYDSALKLKNAHAALEIMKENNIPKETRDFNRITAIKAAIVHNENMINE